MRHRFTLVFDRAGYSPEFFAGQKAQRVAVITYHKFPGEDWPEAEFTPPQPLLLANGEPVTLSLAERGTCLSNGLRVREIWQRECCRSRNRTKLLSREDILNPVKMRRPKLILLAFSSKASA